VLEVANVDVANVVCLGLPRVKYLGLTKPTLISLMLEAFNAQPPEGEVMHWNLTSSSCGWYWPFEM